MDLAAFAGVKTPNRKNVFEAGAERERERKTNRFGGQILKRDRVEQGAVLARGHSFPPDLDRMLEEIAAVEAQIGIEQAERGHEIPLRVAHQDLGLTPANGQFVSIEEAAIIII